jgi:outer membrane protein TolC
VVLNLYQPLYAAGRVGAALKISGYGRKYTDAGIIQARHNIATAADRAYLGAVAAREAEEVYREAEQLADANLAVVQQLYQQGQVSEYDYLRAQVRAANTRPDRIAAANNARLAFDNLRNILALAPKTELQLTTAIEEEKVPDLPLDQLIEEAIQNRPKLRQSEQMININRKLITIASSGYRPSLGVNSRIQWDSFNDKFNKVSLAGDTWNRSWNVALVLSWPIFTGFETAGKIRQAKVDYSQSRLANSQLIRQVRLEVQDAQGKVKEAKQRVEALGETVGQAERGVEIAKVRFENGIGIQLELLDAQVALTTARVNRITALHDLAVAVSELRRAVGREWSPQW